MDAVIEFLNQLVGVFGALAENAGKFIALIAPYPAFAMTTFVLAFAGVPMSSRVFTRARAYAAPGKDRWGQCRHDFFFWGYYTIQQHATYVGLVLGSLWTPPECENWSRPLIVGYLMSAGTLATVLWAFRRAYEKKKGIIFLFPGDSEQPPEDPTVRIRPIRASDVMGDAATDSGSVPPPPAGGQT
jgi:hypothetical protein